MDEPEFRRLWLEKANSPEGQTACLYSLGMTIGNLLVLLVESRAEDHLKTFETIRDLRETLIEVGVDVGILDELWSTLQEEMGGAGSSVWHHLLEDG